MSGIRQRRFWNEGFLPSQAAALAGEDALKKVEMHRKRLEDCQKLRAEFDPMAKKDAEVNARFAKLESSVSGIESSIGDLENLIISKLNS